MDISIFLYKKGNFKLVLSAQLSSEQNVITLFSYNDGSFVNNLVHNF